MRELKFGEERGTIAAQPGCYLPYAAATPEGCREEKGGDPPQGNVEDNGEGQEDHGGSTPSLGNACEGLHGGLVQGRSLWATQPPKRDPSVGGPGPRTPKGLPGQESELPQNCLGQGG